MREGDTVNVFDRAVAAVAPVHAAKRAAARAALKIIDSGYGNYGANLTKKSLRGWEFYGGSAKEDIEDNIFKSITFDNGTEFAAAEELERSCVNKHLPRTKVYFCHPYSSWERGTNENTNGMIRRRFPKGTNFAAVTNAQIVQAENWINNYPRKILGYKSSEIVFRECLRELGIAA